MAAWTSGFLLKKLVFMLPMTKELHDHHFAASSKCFCASANFLAFIRVVFAKCEMDTRSPRSWKNRGHRHCLSSAITKMSNSVVGATFVVESSRKEFTIPVDRSWPINDVINRVLLQSIQVPLGRAFYRIGGWRGGDDSRGCPISQQWRFEPQPVSFELWISRRRQDPRSFSPCCLF